jgi:hypothetical protein
MNEQPILFHHCLAIHFQLTYLLRSFEICFVLNGNSFRMSVIDMQHNYNTAYSKFCGLINKLTFIAM